MKVYNDVGLIKSWCNSPEEGALEQARNLARLPFLFKHVALMPDTHQGYGMPIGGVIACKGVVIPNAVGVDIGCGMGAIKTSLTELSTANLKKIMGLIRARVPVGCNHRATAIEWEGFDNVPNIKVIHEELASARKQLGTLGGGNHFIEIQKGSDGHVWIMLHSGSRNFGYKIAKVFNNLAQELCKQWYSNIPEYRGEDGLAFLPMNTQEGFNYITAMNYALSFAKQNRTVMLDNIKESFKDVVACEFGEHINIHHNYATIESHFGTNVWVHRKGATSAKKGQLGIIPGSQGTSSYIVKGLGNPESFMSCSHGAGRAMSRTKARNTLSLEKEQEILNSKGVIHAIRSAKDLDEASGAYKNIDIVMEEQKDLVEPLVRLEPLGVIKG